MSEPKAVSHFGVRGANDLAALWRALPAAVVEFSNVSWPEDTGLADLCDELRSRCWREYCARGHPSCANRNTSCQQKDSGCCAADSLFPVSIGGGAQSWRMATLFLHWRPGLQVFQLIALGETACTRIAWAAQLLENRFRLPPASKTDVSRLADLELPDAARWRMVFVTPWVIEKNPPGKSEKKEKKPTIEIVTRKLAESLRQRAHKLTVLCTHDPVWQRLGGHLAHLVADHLLFAGLVVEHVTQVHPVSFECKSTGNGDTYHAHAWEGELVLQANRHLLPWLTLLAVCGGGENADKGFGSVQLTPL
ncbi:hypothetical protein SAMN05421690_10734 [Nitrosomonas sp. Nm51]|uniref:hypothetical protein n=1 Tax=Nitrosomonas sp. Nm51 TaxID=133720 RepID=UPI0008C3BFE5|nr:hypothetical protein [Nitrosomonas sp. Nm51]SER77531.1 hypothetical protein SAMN05421690_10734 [Nitrosomonas sp. Nm51]